MAKITRTICIDADVWAKAKERTESVSSVINYLLTRWLETEAEEYERNKLSKMRSELEKSKAEMAIMQKQLEELKKKEERNKPVKTI